MQALTGWYSSLPFAATCASTTVQAPQSPSAQPSFVPVRPRLSRSQVSRVRAGSSRSSETVCPFRQKSRVVLIWALDIVNQIRTGLLTILGVPHSLDPVMPRAEDRVFNAILDAVLDHRLAPGTQLKERELCEIFGVTRGAVRAALTRLGHSLLVELRPNRGAIIANPSLEETRDMFEARRVLEAAIAQRLAKSLTAKQIAELRAFVAEERRAYEKGDRKAGQRLSIRFHKVLSELAGNRTLDRFMEHLICRTPLL